MLPKHAAHPRHGNGEKVPLALEKSFWQGSHLQEEGDGCRVKMGWQHRGTGTIKLWGLQSTSALSPDLGALWILQVLGPVFQPGRTLFSALLSSGPKASEQSGVWGEFRDPAFQE